MGPGAEGFLRWGTNSPLFLNLSFGYFTVTDKFLYLKERKSTLFPTINGGIGLCLNPNSLCHIDIHSRISYFSYQEEEETNDGLFKSKPYNVLGAGWGIGLRCRINTQVKLQSNLDFMKIIKADGNPTHKYSQFRIGFEYALFRKNKKDQREERWKSKEMEENRIIANHVIMNVRFHDRLGNKNGVIDPFERGRVTVALENISRDVIEDLVMQIQITPAYFQNYLEVFPYPYFKVSQIPALEKTIGELQIRAKGNLPKGEFNLRIFSNAEQLSEMITIKTLDPEVDIIKPEIIITQPPLNDIRGIKIIPSIKESSLNLEGIVRDKSKIEWVQVNDRLVTIESVDGGVHFRTKIPITQGKNVIRINAKDKSGNIGELTTSVSRAEIPLMGNTFHGQRWAVVVGISNYKYFYKGIPNLRFADQDAIDFYNYLHEDQGYSEDHIRLLTNEQATIMNVRDALLSFLRQAIEEDLVLIYFAGHGAPELGDPNNLYLLCYDTDPDRMPSTAYHMGDIETAFDRHIASKNVVFFADACHSGGIGRGDLSTLRSTGQENAINNYLERLRNAGEGRVVFTASDRGQLSRESEKWGGGHGVFTYFLLKGLKGDADINNDQIVSAGEIFGYVSQEVRRETYNQQTPRIPFGNFQWDFPLGYVRRSFVNRELDE